MSNGQSIVTIDLAMKYEELMNNIDQLFLIVMGVFVLFMHVGFAFLETGSVRAKNATSSIFRNILDLFAGALVYWAVGFAFAYGEPGNFFIGANHFFSTNVKDSNFTYQMIYRYSKHEIPASVTAELLLSEEPDLSGSMVTLSPSSYFAFWFFQLVFAISATTIASGAIAERVGVGAYLVYCFFMTGFIYPVVSHWCWSKSGWLKSGVGTGLSFQDFAGSAIVHVTGGTAALVGSWMIKPRTGRFYDDSTIADCPGHSVPLTTLGDYILFVGFMAFNGGSVLSLRRADSGVVLATAVTNTIIGGSAGGLSALLMSRLANYLKDEETNWSLLWTINGALAGMVSMCAACNDLYPWSALLIGAIAGATLVDWHYLCLYFKLDDPLDAIGIHLGGGLCGIILGPIFAIQGLEVDGEAVGGVVWGGNTWSWKNWGWNLAGTAAIMVWTALWMLLLFGTMSKLNFLRVDKDVELCGSDIALHKEPAYSHELVRSNSGSQTHFLLNGKNDEEEGGQMN